MDQLGATLLLPPPLPVPPLPEPAAQLDIGGSCCCVDGGTTWTYADSSGTSQLIICIEAWLKTLEVVSGGMGALEQSWTLTHEENST
jgi:hypothetical protein